MLGSRHRPALALAAVITLALMLASGSGIVMPEQADAAPADQRVTVEISQPTPAVRSGQSVRAAVTVSLTAPAEYLEIRLRLRTPEGRLVYQKTEVRSEVAEGRHTITFERAADSPALSQGRYPVEVRVLATDSEPTNASGRVLVLERDTPPQKVAIIARVWATPAANRDGSFTVDPATDSGLRDDLTFITGLATSRRAPLSIIVPPVLLEELGRVAEGYRSVDAEAPVATDTATATEAAETLQLLASAREGGLVTLVDVPYALPDLAGLRAIGASSDLDTHWTRADAVLTATIRSTAASSAAYLGHAPTDAAITTLAARETERLVIPQRSIVAADEEPVAGVRPLGDTGITAVVPDEDASASVDLGSTEFYDVMFDRLGTGPVALIIDAGSDAGERAASIQHALEMIGRADWLELAPLDALQAPEGATALRTRADIESTAPDSHWDAIARSREALLAYREAAGAEDADVVSSTRALLVAQSELWAGSNGSWARSRRAQDMADEVSTFVAGEFGKIIFDAKDVTLSGSAGEVPFTLVNGTGKHLTLTIVATFEGDRVGQETRTVEVEPMQNFITVPVDLRNSITSRLDVQAVSAGWTVAETSLTVHTSYIDRLAWIGIVVVVLLVLLFVIRRRMGSPNAVTIGVDATKMQDRDPDDEQRV
ncbi:MAG: hypothetical protein JXP37_10635 [Coriobacteriia bacterium]|nr:hypothetical protein [Coriobacteriia bacterium]